MKTVYIHTDGACSGNPGPGGWAAILQFIRENSIVAEKEIFGGHPHTTNNRMEMLAAIEGLRTLTEPCEVTVYSDSQLLVKGMTEWLANWKKKGKLTSPTTDLKNVDLWVDIVKLAEVHKIDWVWVKGHSTNIMNNRADALARAAVPKAGK